jgi:probable FeS assembly SUF system protein SufT
MNEKAPVKVARDLEVVQIPEGFKVRLIRGTSVRLMQALGDSYTVMTEYGTMVRVSGHDADAIGEKLVVSAEAAKTADEPKSPEEAKERVWNALRNVYDPEIPVNVVELGLVYNNDVAALPEGGFKVDIKLTLTAPGCGMGPVLQQDAERRIKAIPGIKTANIQLVVDPPWNQTMMSEAARLQLGL